MASHWESLLAMVDRSVRMVGGRVVPLRNVEYRPLLGFPQYWHDEQSGELQAAVLAYLGHKAAEAPPPDWHQLELLRDYLVHYVGAPCWVGEEEAISDLQRRAERIETVQDVGDLIERCLEIGLDPL